MKVVILAGGLGTRLREETDYKPKPMVEIGGKPIIWHIMKSYAHYGFTEFILCLGYKGDHIRDYFLNYETRNTDVTVTLGAKGILNHNGHSEIGWQVTLADTGESTMTGGRIRRIRKYINDDHFMVTYGDGVSNVNIDDLWNFHKTSGKLGTVTAVRPSSRFGELSIENGIVAAFKEKPQVQTGWINGGFFIFHKNIFDLIPDDSETLEDGLLVTLANMKQLAVYQHAGFWQCMDTYREMLLLGNLWNNRKAPWKVWS